jgi:hypothetical protein
MTSGGTCCAKVTGANAAKATNIALTTGVEPALKTVDLGLFKFINGISSSFNRAQ